MGPEVVDTLIIPNINALSDRISESSECTLLVIEILQDHFQKMHSFESGNVNTEQVMEKWRPRYGVFADRVFTQDIEMR